MEGFYICKTTQEMCYLQGGATAEDGRSYSWGKDGRKACPCFPKPHGGERGVSSSVRIPPFSLILLNIEENKENPIFNVKLWKTII